MEYPSETGITEKLGTIFWIDGDFYDAMLNLTPGYAETCINTFKTEHPNNTTIIARKYTDNWADLGSTSVDAAMSEYISHKPRLSVKNHQDFWKRTAQAANLVIIDLNQENEPIATDGAIYFASKIMSRLEKQSVRPETIIKVLVAPELPTHRINSSQRLALEILEKMKRTENIVGPSENFNNFSDNLILV